MPRSLARAVSAFTFAAILATGQTPPKAPAPAGARPRPAAAPAAASSFRDLKYPPLGLVQVPRIASFTLPNGMKLFLLEDHELPSITGVAHIRTGNLFDSPEKVGVAALTGMAMRTGGAGGMTGEQLDIKLEDLGGSVDSAIDESAGEVSFFSLTGNAAAVLGAFRDVLTAPAFRIDQVDLARLRLRNLVLHGNDNGSEILFREFPAILYGGDSPYGWTLRLDRLDRIVRADLLAFHHRYFFPKNAMVAMWGDFETAKMKELLEQLFAGWTVEQPPVPEFPKVEAKPAPGIYVAKKVDATQTHFAIGQLAGKIGDKDFPALAVMASVLGGSVASRLVQRLSVRMADAYNVTAEWAAGFDHPGLFKISGIARPVSTVAVIKAVHEEVERIRTAEVSEDELRTAKDSALNRLAFASGNRRKILNRILSYAYFGYPADFSQQYQKALAGVTRADVLRVAKEYLQPANLTTLVVGDPENFVPPLESLGGTVREIDMTIPEPKAHAVSADAASLEEGKRILARLQSAVGGADKLAAVKDYTAVYEMRLAAASGGETITETDRWMAPGNFREEADRTYGKSMLYSDGKSGWGVRGRNSTALNGATLKAMQGDVFRSYFGLLLSDRVAGRTVTALDPNTVEIATADGLSVQVALDPETGLPQQFSYLNPVTSGPPVLVQEVVTKFGEVAGVRVPYEISSRQDGNPYSKCSVKDFKVNSGLVLSDLEKRP